MGTLLELNVERVRRRGTKPAHTTPKPTQSAQIHMFPGVSRYHRGTPLRQRVGKVRVVEAYSMYDRD